jgi:bacteriophage Mu gam like protein
MTTVKKTRIKAQTLEAPQSKEETQRWIRELGDLQRKHGRTAAAMNDEIAVITHNYTPALNELQEQIEEKLKGIQVWCEAHRDELTDGKSKTANLVTGEVSWRVRPPSVAIRGVDAVLENLRARGLERFIRIKEEPNKEAMLNEPDIAAGVAGITIKRGIEDFVVTPHEISGEQP